MPKYTCQRCLKVFSQKSHYTKHLKKKNPCQNNKEKLELIVEEKVEKLLENIISEKKLNQNENENEIINNKELNNMAEESKTGEHNVVVKFKKTNRILYQNDNILDNNFKQTFLSFINKMHNLLRGSAVTGDQALDDILYTLL